ncbi:MAG: hypothetical protein ACP5HM_05315 [Anaerolineae bacterium]
MADPITDQTAYLLEHDAAIFVPLDTLYEALLEQGLMSQFDLDAYHLLLKSDERFEVLNGLEELLFGDEVDIWSGWYVLDFLSGPWVRLRTRAISPELLLQDLLWYLEEMNETLEATWQYLPEGPESEEARRDLLNLLMWGDLLERHIREALAQMVDLQGNPPGNA